VAGAAGVGAGAVEGAGACRWKRAWRIPTLMFYVPIPSFYSE
jgi:hypothetical protein